MPANLPPNLPVEPPAITCRRLGAADATAYHALRLQGLKDEPEAFGASWEEEQGMTLAQVAARLPEVGESSACFGAFAGETLIGTVALVREQRLKAHHKALLVGMRVAPAHRGQGVGLALVRQALQEASRWPGLRVLQLGVHVDNKPAIALYEAAGFRTYGREPAALSVGGTLHDEFLMALWLHGHSPGL